MRKFHALGAHSPYNPADDLMDPLLKNLFRGLGRIFPDCITLSQAIAFNMFLAFFPMLLLALGVISSTESFHGALREVPERLKLILLAALPGTPMELVADDEWHTEYGDLILAVKVVPGLPRIRASECQFAREKNSCKIIIAIVALHIDIVFYHETAEAH